MRYGTLCDRASPRSSNSRSSLAAAGVAERLARAARGALRVTGDRRPVDSRPGGVARTPPASPVPTAVACRPRPVSGRTRCTARMAGARRSPGADRCLDIDRWRVAGSGHGSALSSSEGYPAPRRVDPTHRRSSGYSGAQAMSRVRGRGSPDHTKSVPHLRTSLAHKHVPEMQATPACSTAAVRAAVGRMPGMIVEVPLQLRALRWRRGSRRSTPPSARPIATKFVEVAPLDEWPPSRPSIRGLNGTTA